MAVKFYKGASIEATRKTSQSGKSESVQKKSMPGMPGFIKTGQDTSSGGLTSSAGIGPKKPGPIGSKGGTSVKAHFTAAKSRGSADKSYRATSTGPAGKISAGKMESLKGKAPAFGERK